MTAICLLYSRFRSAPPRRVSSKNIADAAVIFSESRLKPWGTAHIQRGALVALIGLIWAATGLGTVHRVATGSLAGVIAVGAVALLTVVAGLVVRSAPTGAALSAAALVPVTSALALAVPGHFGAPQITLAAAGVAAWSLISLVLPRREIHSAITFSPRQPCSVSVCCWLPERVRCGGCRW